MRTVKNFIFMMMIFSLATSGAFSTTVSEIASQLICTCKCNMVVSDCNCGTADDMRTLIQGSIHQGMDKTSILNDFASQYGEKVLAAPTKSGFNLTAWTLPFIVLLVAAVVVTLLIQAWVRTSKESGALVTPSTLQKNAQDWERLKKELEQFDA